MHEKRVGKAYMRELMGSLALYMVLLFAAIRWGRPMEEGVARTLVLLSPMIGFGLALWAIARHFGRIDEYVRMRLLETIALAAAITAGLTFSYGFLETAGYPKLSMFTVWCVLCGSVVVVQLARKLLDR
ncbi:hypothetical protein [Massilia sp. BSC265]|uniref:hypothetical protein n=1 Tax=Massilia sp. BSC265 TaxID=1549812 RepID=UPI00056BC840|nr:hypothetical protein [Massilia sp. BSC265]